MAIQIVNVEPRAVSQTPVHKPNAVDKLKAARDRKVYKRDLMRQRRVQERVDAIFLAASD
jgi:hypothetical protein